MSNAKHKPGVQPVVTLEMLYREVIELKSLLSPLPKKREGKVKLSNTARKALILSRHAKRQTNC